MSELKYNSRLHQLLKTAPIHEVLITDKKEHGDVISVQRNNSLSIYSFVVVFFSDLLLCITVIRK